MGAAIQSALGQSLPVSEILVVDDASTDETASVLGEWESKDARVRVHRQSSNQGIARNVDWAMRNATGDLIVRLDSDDELDARAIERLSDALMAYPAAGYAHGAIVEVDADDNFRRLRSLARGPYHESEAALRATLRGYRVAANLIMFRRNALQRAGYISSNRNFAEDYYLSVRIADVGFGNVYIPDVVGRYRVWTDDGGVRASRKVEEIEGLIEVFDNAIGPAFRKREWGQGGVARARSRLASNHAAAIDRIDDSGEREVLQEALLRLSSSARVRLTLAARRRGVGHALDRLKSFNRRGRDSVKSALRRARII
ncbi:glycosyltransferase family 2 protein [Microbacterium marinum]|uniref:glycosyltransferase family 2 protein n=1 Tax=Microbacterium marinum TaxID=421115 RepID=UPI0031B5BDD4